MVIRSRLPPIFLKQWRCCEACKLDLSVSRTIWGLMNLANKFRKADSASAGELWTCGSQDVFSGAGLCQVKGVAFRIHFGCEFGGGGREGSSVSGQESILEVQVCGCYGILKPRQQPSVVPMSVLRGCVLGLISFILRSLYCS